MKRRVHIKFHSKQSITITNALAQKHFDLSKLDNGAYIDLIHPKVYPELGVPNNARFMARYYKVMDEEHGTIDHVVLEVWYRARGHDDWLCIGYAQMQAFHYKYMNRSNDKFEKANEGTFEVTILD